MKLRLIRRNINAFTMIELLVVVAIIGILSGLIIVGMGSLTQDARDGKRKAEIDAVRKALWSQSNMGTKSYPVETNWCCLGKTGDCTTLASVLVPDFLGKLPQDPSYNPLNKESCYMYKSNGTTFDLYTKLEKKGSISLSPESVKISESQSCDEANGWIDTGLGFCVMQWEAKIQGDNNGNQTYNAAFVPESRSAGTPWVNISQINAIAECKSIGAHLINNAEWMALARDIESVSSNYTGGVLNRGNVGDTAAGDYNGADPEAGVTNALATLTLSNGKTINHFSGNVWEWVDYTISGAGSQPQVPSQTSFGWQEINAVTDFGNNLGYNNVGPKNTSLNGSTGAGRIYYQSTYTSERALARGGRWDGGSNAGVFALWLTYSTSGFYATVGCRCAR
ncbi:MAG: prepilin-type N-terminal cleavage/methylation domain-containing protein [Candidatus Paceibacterota bacterium]|jgi:prepilin-type N-terminal cleavage/methylation domain-containing protein